MKGRKTSLLVVVVLLVGVAAGVLWKRDTPYQAPYWSPNRQYYVQKYARSSRLPLPTLPGQGSDAVDGYIRLYDNKGTLIHERSESFIRDIEPLWSGNKVYLRGVTEMDNNPWILPSSSQ
jgi:hypothetical protein